MWFFILGLIPCAGKPVSSSCPVEMSPPSVVVRFGDPLSANCSTSTPIEGMGWESSYGGTGSMPDVSSLPLEIKSAMDWAIEPKCYINPLEGDQCFRILPITVYKMPDRVLLTASQEGPMTEGAQYRMQCDIINVAPVRNLSVLWRSPRKTYFTERFNDSSRSPVSKSSVLTLTADRDDDGHLMWCEAKLDFSQPVQDIPAMISGLHAMSVLYPPTFTKPANETLEISSGSKIVLDCTATGNPEPVYSWHFPHRIQQNKNESQPIWNTTFQLPGTYKCTASNTQGTKTKYFTVTEAKSSHPGTTAGILMAVFFLLIFILACVVYHKQRNSSVARPEQMS